MRIVITPQAEDLRKHLIKISGDSDYPLSTAERALYSLLTLPIMAQSACSADERETVIRTVTAAIDAAVSAAMHAIYER